MTRFSYAIAVTILISLFVLVWVAMPTVHGGTPVWIIVDALVAQVVILAAISKLRVR